MKIYISHALVTVVDAIGVSSMESLDLQKRHADNKGSDQSAPVHKLIITITRCML